MSSTRWTFTPLDTWFFRESRPHGSVGGSELSSVFPPPARTLAGAVRTLIGEHNGVNWGDFANGKSSLNDAIGYTDAGTKEKPRPEFGQLQLTGPFITQNGKRLYPAPAFLFTEGDEGKTASWLEFRSAAVECDLGPVRLPKVEPGSKPLNGYITEDALKKVLAGGNLSKENGHWIKSTELFTEEPRLGIALDHGPRSASQGMLYQTRHLRFAEGVGVALEISGTDDKLHPDNTDKGRPTIRLGGEGRFAAVKIGAAASEVNFQSEADAAIASGRIVLLALTDVLVPSEFKAEALDGLKLDGKPDGYDISAALTLECAVLGKAKREGGWDVANHAPRPVRSLIPAGSAWFCTVANGRAVELKERIDSHGCLRVGDETQIGRGLLAVGQWPERSWNPGGGK